jgi:hypothetical protein
MPLGFKVLTNWRPSTHFKIDITEFNIKWSVILSM